MNVFSLTLGSVLLLAPAAIAGAADAPATPAKTKLAVGDKAPEFKCSRWLKNGPVEAIKPGRVHVVEFWATWCGPCKRAIPHITEMAKTYKDKVTFIGVDIMERGPEGEALDEKVDAFVKTMGDRMDYPICRDTADRHMRRAWFEASGQEGIPACFIVDTQGRIAWIGNPLVGLDEALPAILQGSFDARAFDAGTQNLQHAYRALVDQDYKAVLERAENLPESIPAQADQKRILVLLALLHLDDAKAEQLYARMAAAGQDMIHMAHHVYDVEGLPAKWYLRAIAILEKAKDWENLGPLAIAQWRAGRKEEARATQERYLARIREEKVKNPSKASLCDLLLEKAEKDQKLFD